MRNAWLLVQLGKDDHYFVAAYTARRTAENEGNRDEKYGVPYVIVNLDELMRHREGGPVGKLLRTLPSQGEK